MVGTTPARIGSAAAVLRRVVEGSPRRGADRALDDGKIMVLRPPLLRRGPKPVKTSLARGVDMPFHINAGPATSNPSDDRRIFFAYVESLAGVS
jgi:hypothetical protein